ncbi:hypothetical protein BSIN_4705 [Burkholderia singularis]|uniref:Uncharacterized protein n=1 Tax=Burkholderia singularis TaxID=1503053 RepID=A0A238HA98_9BURK|nr:hypothetical protein BSIN_4705 [Burkholderia singularis]
MSRGDGFVQHRWGVSGESKDDPIYLMAIRKGIKKNLMRWNDPIPSTNFIIGIIHSY